MPRGYVGDEEDLNALREDGTEEWVLEVLADGLHPYVFFHYFHMDQPRERKGLATQSVISSIILEGVDSGDVAPYPKAITEALNEADIPTPSGAGVWNLELTRKYCTANGLGPYLEAMRHDDNVAHLLYLRATPMLRYYR